MDEPAGRQILDTLLDFRDAVSASFDQMRTEMNARFADMDSRFTGMDERFAKLESRLRR